MIYYLIGLLAYYKAKKKAVPAGVCLLFFLAITIVPITTLYVLLDKHWVLRVITFVAGLFCWTFIEYFFNRFWLYKREKTNNYKYSYNLHHTKIQQIFSPWVNRLIILSVALLINVLSFSVNWYLLLPAGIITGFSFFNYIHNWLHKPQSVHRFIRLKKFHMQHHFSNPEKCFGVTNTWWDRLFNTTPITAKNLGGKLKKINFDTDETKTVAINQ